MSLLSSNKMKTGSGFYVFERKHHLPRDHVKVMTIPIRNEYNYPLIDSNGEKTWILNYVVSNGDKWWALCATLGMPNRFEWRGIKFNNDQIMRVAER